MAVVAEHTLDIRHFDASQYHESICGRRIERFSTAFCVVFLPSVSAEPGSEREQLLAAAYSTGHIRLFHVQEVTHAWLSRQQPGRPTFCWQAHAGAVYCLACHGSGSGATLLSGGDDGLIKAWRVADLVASCNSGGGKPDVLPCFSAQVPRAESVWGSIGFSPAVLTLSVDAANNRVYAGATDGGVSELDLERACPLATLSGHAASVLSTDYSGAVSLLASGSEDGTVRLWDCRSHKCNKVIDPWNGEEVPQGNAAKLLQCIKSSHISAVRFESGGSWLLCGHGSSALSMWSMAVGALAKQISTTCVPQALHVLPGEILMVGTAPQLFRYRFAGDEPSETTISPRSAFWIDVHPENQTLAICGANGTIDLLSHYGSKLGSVFHPFKED